MRFHLIEDYLELHEGENTRRSYRQDLDHLVKCKIIGWKDVSDLIDRYKRLMRAQGYSDSTIQRRLAVAKLYFQYENFAGEEGRKFLAEVLKKLLDNDSVGRDTTIYLLIICFQISLKDIVAVGDGIRNDGFVVFGVNAIKTPRLLESILILNQNEGKKCMVSLDTMHLGEPLTRKAVMRVIGRMMRQVGVDLTAKKLAIIMAASFGKIGKEQKRIITKALQEKLSEQEKEKCVENAQKIEDLITKEKRSKN